MNTIESLISGRDIAIQKSGRLTEQSLAWLNEKANCRFPVTDDPFDRTRELIDEKTGARVLGYSNGDVLKAVVCGQVDYAIAGEDKVDDLTYPVYQPLVETTALNSWANLTKLGPVGQTGWRVAVARREGDYFSPVRRIATSYPNLARKWLKSEKTSVEKVAIDEYSGGVENIAKNNGYDTVVDVVHSGETLKANGFVETKTLGWYNPVIVRIYRDPLSPELFDAMNSTSIMDIMCDRLAQRRLEPTDSEASRLVTDQNEAIKKLSSEVGELIVELSLNRDIELEAADVLYSLCATLVERNIDIKTIFTELGGRYNGQALYPLWPKQTRQSYSLSPRP